MSKNYFVDEVFSKESTAPESLLVGEYEQCAWKQINFEQVNLSNFIFIDCVFSHCDLSLCKVQNTAFRNCQFIDCKMLGLRFDECNPFLFAIKLSQCNLQLTSFQACNLKKSLFKQVKFHEVDFSKANLSESIFDECDLTRAQFEQSNLEKVDFRTAFNFIIDPERNKLKKAKFSLHGTLGLLSKYDIQVD